jgi:hypothetical protein
MAEFMERVVPVIDQTIRALATSKFNIITMPNKDRKEMKGSRLHRAQKSIGLSIH